MKKHLSQNTKLLNNYFNIFVLYTYTVLLLNFHNVKSTYSHMLSTDQIIM